MAYCQSGVRQTLLQVSHFFITDRQAGIEQQSSSADKSALSSY